MKPTVQLLKLGLIALLLAMPTYSLPAAPPHTGIRGQAVLFFPGFAVEEELGVWIGVGSITLPVASSFTVLSAHLGRVVGHFAADSAGAFQVPLPPGKYVIVPDTRFGLAATPGSFEITVKARHFTEVVITYTAASISSLPTTASP